MKPDATTLFPQYLLNPDYASEVSTDPAVQVVVDAVMSQRALTPEMLVGLPATISINGDSYPGKVVGVTESLNTIKVEYTGLRRDKVETFRWSAKHGRYQNRVYSLSIGVADTHRVQEF